MPPRRARRTTPATRWASAPPLRGQGVSEAKHLALNAMFAD